MKKILLLSISLLSIVSCAQFDVAVDPTTKNKIFFSDGFDKIKFERVKEFKIETDATWLFWGNKKSRVPEISTLLNGKISELGGNGVVGLKVQTEETFGQGFLGILTLGIYQARNVTISGTVVKFNSVSLNYLQNLKDIEMSGLQFENSMYKQY